MREFSVADTFSPIPGGRFARHGPHSGEDLRELHLIPLLCEEKEGVLVDLHGLAGFPPSFAEEAFGGLGRRLGPSVVTRVEFRGPEHRVAVAERCLRRGAGVEEVRG